MLPYSLDITPSLFIFSAFLRQSPGSAQWIFLPVFESHIACQVSPNTHLLLYWFPSVTCCSVRCWLKFLFLPRQDMLRPCPAAGLAPAVELCHWCFCLVSILWPEFSAAILLLSQKIQIQFWTHLYKKSKEWSTSGNHAEFILLYLPIRLPCLWFLFWRCLLIWI